MTASYELQDFESALADEIRLHSVSKSFAAGTVILEPGRFIGSLPIVINGAIRITRTDGNGRELLLYYLEAGETCAATISCCMAKQRSTIRAVVELDAEILFVPMERVDEWVARYHSWRSFIFRSFSERFDELLEAVDSVAFRDLEERLLTALHDKANLHGSQVLDVTHQQLADELHSSRVVVSRLLKAIEHRGLVTLGRNKLTLHDPKS